MLNKEEILNSERCQEIKGKFIEVYSQLPTDYFSAPARIEIIGNHTDYNGGKVIAATIDEDMLAASIKTDDDYISVKSGEYPAIIIKLDSLEMDMNEKEKSIGMVRGILYGFRARNLNFGGLKMVIDSNIFKGAGLSSSSALEMCIAFAINYYYNEGQVDTLELAKICQYAENNYFGKPTGYVDPAIISLGGCACFDFKDIDNPIIKTIDFKLENYRLVLVNTGGSHSKLASYMTSIRNDMKKIAVYFGENFLVNVDEKNFFNNIHYLYNSMGGRAVLRAIHFYDENKRVENALSCLKESDESGFVTLINQSGDSSYMKLQNCGIDADQNQAMMLALNLSKKILLKGGCRVHGSGFAGTILAIVHENEYSSYSKVMAILFGKEAVKDINIRAEGVVRLN